MAENENKTPAPPKTSKEGRGFHRETLRFVQQVESLSISSPSIIAFARNIWLKLAGEFLEFLEANAKATKEEGSVRTFTLEGTAASESVRLQRSLSSAQTTYVLVSRGFLSSLISQYDSFLGRIIREIFLVQPEILNASDKQLTFGDITRFASIEEARSFIIEKEVESVVRKGHADHFTWLEKTLTVKLRERLDIWPTFIEITERRNLFAHCDGIVSSQYIDVCKKNGLTLGKDIKVGAPLKVDQQYLATAFKCIFEIGVKLAQVIWRKLLPDDLENADLTLNQVCYDLLLRQENEIARALLDFACCTLKNHSSERTRRTFVLNRAQVYKWMGSQLECQKIVEAEDWSACNETMQIAVAVLMDRHSQAASIMPHLKGEPEFPQAYKDWPIFRNFRESPEFLKAYQEVYKTSFTVQQVTRTGSEEGVLLPLDPQE
jgi:hypothetical protein